MSGKPAKAPKRKTKVNPNHQKAWRSMRILREWSVPDLVCTIQGATVPGISKFVRALERHGIVEKVPGYKKGRVGDHQHYRIYAKLADHPTPPQICHLCAQVVTAKICDPTLKHTEPETKAAKRSEALKAQFAAMPDLTPAELEQIEADFYPKKERDTQTNRETELDLAQYPSKGWHVVPAELKRRLMGGIHDAA